MVRTLPKWETRILDSANCFANFVDRRLEYATNLVAISEQVLPKLITLHLQRSPSLEHRGDRYDQGSSGGRSARAMAVQENRKSTEERKVRFPPPKAWDPEEKWNYSCVMGNSCSEKHHLAKCETFKGMTPQPKLTKVQERELCKLCFRHLDTREC
jgi:hypothetical protein